MDTNQNISSQDGSTLTVSRSSPLFDLLDYYREDLETPMLLEVLATYAGHIEEATEQAVTRARGEGKTWDAIGQALGMTRQGAQQRYGR